MTTSAPILVFIKAGCDAFGHVPVPVFVERKGDAALILERVICDRCGETISSSFLES